MRHFALADIACKIAYKVKDEQLGVRISLLSKLCGGGGDHFACSPGLPTCGLHLE